LNNPAVISVSRHPCGLLAKICKHRTILNFPTYTGLPLLNENFVKEKLKNEKYFYGMAVALYDFEEEETAMKAFTAKLVDLTQRNAEEIARQWARM